MGWIQRLFTPSESLSHARADGGTSDPATGLVPPRESGRGVSTGEALGLSAVYRAVSIRATAAKQLSIDVFKGDRATTAPLWIRKPDIGTPRATFVEQTVTSLNLSGNAYWRIRRDDKNRVQSLEVLNPLDVQIRQADSGRVIGFTHRGHDLGTDEVKHLSRLRVPGTPYGLGPIQAAAAELRGAIDLRDYASNWISSGDVPSGVLKSDQILSPEQAAAARTNWETTRGGKRGVAVLGAGLGYQAVFVNAKDAQFIESQQFTTTQIARLFGVPASLMLAAVEGGSQTYANVEQDWLGFIRFGLMDDLLEIEEALSDLLPLGQRARFNVEALLRTDTKTRYEAHNLGIDGGWLLPSEVRGIENLAPIEGIDDRPRKAAA